MHLLALNFALLIVQFHSVKKLFRRVLKFQGHKAISLLQLQYLGIEIFFLSTISAWGNINVWVQIILNLLFYCFLSSSLHKHLLLQPDGCNSTLFLNYISFKIINVFPLYSPDLPQYLGMVHYLLLGE
jgi:hypothetical protein